MGFGRNPSREQGPSRSLVSPVPRRIAAALFAGLALLAAPAAAQQLSTVTFTVISANGACPVDGAKVSITDDPLGASAKTDSGGFAIVSLMKGTYSWKVSATDYDTATGSLTVSSIDGPSVNVTLIPTDGDSDECVG